MKETVALLVGDGEEVIERVSLIERERKGALRVDVKEVLQLRDTVASLDIERDADPSSVVVRLTGRDFVFRFVTDLELDRSLLQVFVSDSEIVPKLEGEAVGESEAEAEVEVESDTEYTLLDVRETVLPNVTE